MTAQRGVPEDKPIITLLIDRLADEFRSGFGPRDEIWDEDVRLWIGGLGDDDLLETSIKRMIQNNPGWCKLIARRVTRRLRCDLTTS